MTFTYASLFSGIGGFEQALNKLGGICVFASENDKFAARAYEVLYGFKPAGDITKIDAKDIPDHDLLTAGFPCQAFSVAGKRKGFEDTRGTLFFEIARIAKEKRPKALLLENVKGLVNHDKGRTLDIMISILNEIGYVIDFEVLNSKYFGVPQNRERIFIVAIREDLIEAEPFNEYSLKGNTIVRKKKRQINEWAKTFNFDWPEQTEVTTRLRDILETDVDEKYYLDEEKTAKLVAQLEEKDKIVGTVGHHPFSKKYEFKGYNSEISPSLIATDYKAPKTVLESESQMLGHVDIKGHDAIKRVYSTESVGSTLTTMGGGHGELKVAEEVRPVLTPDRLNKRQNGRRFKENDEEMFTLTSQDKHGVVIRKKRKYRIRKLTPRECWRLQGFPDEAHDAVKDAGISDSQRYKQAGNAVTVNVVEAIGKRLIPLIS